MQKKHAQKVVEQICIFCAGGLPKLVDDAEDEEDEDVDDPEVGENL
jgi:hypothetical protein